MNVCEVPGCGRARHSRSLCKAHFWRWKRRGDVFADVPIGAPLPFECLTCEDIERLLDDYRPDPNDIARRCLIGARPTTSDCELRMQLRRHLRRHGRHDLLRMYDRVALLAGVS